MADLTPLDRFALIAGALCRAVAACLGRGLMDVPMIVLVWTRIRRTEVAFLALAERVRSGRFRGGWVRQGGVARDGVRRAVAPDRGWLPVRFGWLMGVMPYEAAGYASQLRTVLAEPEMAAMLRDVPQARRILGSVCRMLGVEIPPVRPVRPVPPVPPVPPMVARVAPGADDVEAVPETGRKQVARIRTPVDWGRIPLPRGVLAAARRQGYGKVR